MKLPIEHSTTCDSRTYLNLKKSNILLETIVGSMHIIHSKLTRKWNAAVNCCTCTKICDNSLNDFLMYISVHYYILFREMYIYSQINILVGYRICTWFITMNKTTTCAFLAWIVQ